MKPILLCLHGWGGSGESFTELRAALEGSNLTILTPDLPGFGAEPEPPRAWTNDDYADWVEKWFQSEVRSPKSEVLLLGHSHGGRVAIILAARQKRATRNEDVKSHVGDHVPFTGPTSNFTHLFLCAPAGIRRGQYLKRTTGWIMAKTGRLLLSVPIVAARFQPLAKRLFYRLLHVHDYEVASPAMRQTMVLVTSQNMRPLLSHIKIPTDIFWGEDDQITPLRDGRIAQGEIKGSTLHVYPHVRHRVHRDRAKEIAGVISACLRPA
ncbi:alpha/beta hydrolase [Candidatus Uhrbacteria bacterium]|nr:alpha/beta hydrolase [Candidatus Uhrbacteria bacterium]